MIERAFLAFVAAYIAALIVCAVVGGALLPIAGALAALAGAILAVVVLAAAIFGRFHA